MDFLAVKEWRKHQHYGKRRPPWIKLYANLLTDAKFAAMPEAAQAQLMKLWILASQFGHPLPNNPKLLAGKIGTTGRFYLSTLIDAGFLIPCEQNAIEMLAPTLANDGENATPLSTENREQSSDTTTDLQQQRETVEPDALNGACTELVARLGGEAVAGRTVADFIGELPIDKRLAWARNLIAVVEPLGGGAPASPDQLLLAMRDFLVADRQRWPFNGRVFRAFVDDVRRPKQERRSPADTNDPFAKWAADTDAKERADRAKV